MFAPLGKHIMKCAAHELNAVNVFMLQGGAGTWSGHETFFFFFAFQPHNPTARHADRWM